MNKVNEYISLYESDAIAIRREIHKHPELSMAEKETTKLVKEKLLEYGLEFADVELASGVAAILKGALPGKTILFRADLDALPIEERSGLPFASKHPGVAHCCGHDIHTSALLLAARILGQMKDQIAGQIIFLFQPAEERLGGSKMVIGSGLFEKYKPDFAVSVHCWPEIPAGTIGIRKGPFMAATDTIKIRVTGKGGHGAHPHKSIDPVMTAAYILTQLQAVVSRSVAPLDSAVLTIGKIMGGTVANVIPDEVVMEGTVRTVTRETRELMEKKIRTVAGHGAAAMGAECEVEYRRGHSAVICDSDVVEQIERAAAEVIGPENVVTLATPSMGSEDFANYLELVPGAIFRLGTANENPQSRLPLHNAGIVFDERAIAAGAAVICQMVMNQKQFRFSS